MDRDGGHLSESSPSERRESAGARRESRRVRATVVFADLVGFSSISERLGTERAYLVTTGALQLLDRVARKHGGSVDKYLGDALLAVFGHPIPLANAAEAAVHAAAEMRRAVADYNEELALDPPLALVVGVNTGDVVAGDLSGGAVREFHVLGDAVNTAARLKAKAPSGSVYVGPETARESRDAFEYRALPPLALKGKREPVAVSELVEARGGRARAALAAGAGGAAELTLIGREEERERLAAFVARLGREGSQVLWIEGPEGMGKTRLLSELARSLEVAVLRARASLIDRGRSLLLLRGILEEWAELEGGPGTSVGDALTHAFAGEAGALERVLSPILTGDGAEDAASAADALARLLEHATKERALVVALDDLHWADPASVSLLEELVRRSGNARVGFAFTARSEGAERAALEPLLERLRERRAGCCEELRLRPLAPSESRRLLDVAAGEEPLPAEIAARIVDRAGGSPARLVHGVALAPALRAVGDPATEDERASEAERRRATVLFADITGFTAMTERIGAERAYPIVVGLLELLDEVARRHGGSVDKYLGDCVLALFGVPKSLEDAPRAAVNAAIEMRRRVREYNAELALDPPLDVHSGIATGLAIAGEIGGSLLREFAVMGEAVQLADALKDLSPPGVVYVGAGTEHLTREVFDYRPREPVTLRGRSARFDAFELVSRDEQLYRSRAGGAGPVVSPLVGRDEELATLRQALDDLAGGRGGIVSVVAEAGIGKSRLIGELEASPGAERVRWCEGRCLSTGGQLSFHPFADLLRAWSGIQDEDDDARARERLAHAVRALLPEESDEILPFIASLIGLRRDAEGEGGRSQPSGEVLEAQLRYSVTSLLRAESERQPLVVVLEDLHWADLSSLELLESLLRLVPRHRILFLNLMRPGFDETAGRIARHAAEQHPDRTCEIRLAPLGARAARLLLAHLFDESELPVETRRLIEEKSRGNPFYIEEVVRSLLAEGAVEHRDGRLRVTERIHSVTIPDTINEVVMARVDALGARLRRLLQVASVLGESFHEDVLEELCGAEGVLSEDLDALLAAEFLAPIDRLRGVEYAFRHPLIREVTYEGLLLTRREELHREVAGAIERRLPADLPGFQGMLAYHLTKGRDTERAESYLLRAGEEAARVAASSEALHFFREALRLYYELHPGGGDPAKRALLEKNIARALFHKGRLIESVEHLDAAMELLGESVPRTPAALGLRLARNLLVVLPRLYVPRLAGRRPASDVEREVIDLMLERGECEITTDPVRFVADSIELVAKVQRRDPSTVPASPRAFAGASQIFSYGGVSFGISARFLALASRFVREDEVRDLFMYRLVRFIHHMLEGDWSEEHEVPPSLLERALESGALWEVATYLGVSAYRSIAAGAFERAEERIGRCARMWEHYEYDVARQTQHAMAAILNLERRRLDAALDAAQTYYEEHAEDLLRLLALGLKARTQVLRGDHDDAEETLERCRVVAKRTGRATPLQASASLLARFQLDVARLEAARDAGDRAAVRRLVRRSARSGRVALQTARWVATCRTEAYSLAGTREWLSGRPSRAESLWRRSLEAGTRLGARPGLARAHLEVGRWLSRAERPRQLAGLDAAAHLERAETHFRALGLTWDLEQVERARAHLG